MTAVWDRGGHTKTTLPDHSPKFRVVIVLGIHAKKGISYFPLLMPYLL
jgi:hypothetical protein